MLLMHHKKQKKEIAKAKWVKKFCSHTIKNIVSTRAIWQDADFAPRILNWNKALAKFDQEWKHVFAYVDYDFRNQKWATPPTPKSFGITDVRSFCTSAMSHAQKALESVTRRLEKW